MVRFKPRIPAKLQRWIREKKVQRAKAKQGLHGARLLYTTAKKEIHEFETQLHGLPRWRRRVWATLLVFSLGLASGDAYLRSKYPGRTYSASQGIVQRTQFHWKKQEPEIRKKLVEWLEVPANMVRAEVPVEAFRLSMELKLFENPLDWELFEKRAKEIHYLKPIPLQ